jgi:hypothetical protein
MESTTEKRSAGLIESTILPQPTFHLLSLLSLGVTGSALLRGASESKIPTPVQKRRPQSHGLQGLQRTINSVDYYHCVYELLYRLIESSIALVPNLSPSYGAPHHETPTVA